MKKYYLFIAVFLSVTFLSAQNSTGLMLQDEKTSLLAESKQKMFMESLMTKHKELSSMDRVIKAKPLEKVAEKDMRVDTSLLVKMVQQRDGVTTHVEKYEYDQFGLLKYVLEGTDEENSEKRVRYTYTIGKFNYWTSCDKEINIGDDKWIKYEKNERVYDDIGQLVETKVYYYDNDSKKLFLNSHQQYDYEHPILDSKGQETYGVCIANQVYSPSGDIVYSERFKWFDYLQEYIQTEKDNKIDAVKFITNIGEDSISITKYGENDIFEKESIYYYGNRIGTGQKKPFEDGEEGIDFFGLYYEKSSEIIEPGYHTMFLYLTSVDMTKLRFVVLYKDCNPFTRENMFKDIDLFSPETFLKEIGADVDAKITDYTFIGNGEIIEDGEPTSFLYKTKWLNDYLLRETTTYDDSENVEYELYNDSSKVVGKAYLNSDSSYVCSLDNGTYWMFSPDHKKVSEFSKFEDYYPDESFSPISIPMIKFSEEENLRKYKHLEVPYYDFWWGNRHIVYDLDEQYRITSIKVTPLGVDSVLNEERYYEYLDNGGIIVRAVLHNNYADCPAYGIEEIIEKCIYSEDGTASYEMTRKIEGELESAKRRVLTNDSLIVKYEYDKATDSFVKKWVSCLDRVSKDSSNITTKIKRDVVDGKIVNNFKREEFQDENHEYKATYDWNVQEQCWTGQQKYYRGTTYLNIAINDNLNPTGLYDDTSRYPAIPQAIPKGNKLFVPSRFDSHIDYEWNNEKKDWKVTEKELYFVDEEKGKVKITHKYLFSEIEVEEIYTLSISEEHNLEGYEYVSRYSKLGTGEQTHKERSVVTYQFNENNCLVEKREELYDEDDALVSVGVDTYEYGDFVLSPTAIEKVIGDSKISVEGRNISVPQGESVKVYNEAGQLCVIGHDNVTVPCMGTYIINSQGKNFKVYIR